MQAQGHRFRCSTHVAILLIVQARRAGYKHPFCYDESVRTDEKIARAAGKMARQWAPTAKQSGSFLKHVMPAVVKPIHSLWHEILAFLFLAVAGLCAWKIWRTADTARVGETVLVSIFAIVMAAYGISSYRKSRRISRS